MPTATTAASPDVSSPLQTAAAEHHAIAGGALLQSLKTISEQLRKAHTAAHDLGYAPCADKLTQLGFGVGSAMRLAHPGASGPVEELRATEAERRASGIVAALEAVFLTGGALTLWADKIGTLATAAALDWATGRGDAIRIEMVHEMTESANVLVIRLRGRSLVPGSFEPIIATIYEPLPTERPPRSVIAAGDVAQVGGAL